MNLTSTKMQVMLPAHPTIRTIRTSLCYNRLPFPKTSLTHILSTISSSSSQKPQRSSPAHRAIPETATWSLSSLLPPASSSPSSLDQEFSEEQLDKLHRLGALIAPPLGSEERALLKSQLAAMLRLVKGVYALHVPFGSVRGWVDARPLARYDGCWNVSLPNNEKKADKATGEAGKKEKEVLAPQALLAKVDESRKYQQFFVVDRT